MPKPDSQHLLRILGFGFAVTIGGTIGVVCYLSGFASLFVLRKREPELERPFRAWGYPWVPGIALAGSVLFLAGNLVSDTRHSLIALALIGASYPVFLAVGRKRKS